LKIRSQGFFKNCVFGKRSNCSGFPAKRLTCFVFLLLLFGFTTGIASAETLWGITPGMAGPEALRLLGKPTQEKEEEDSRSYLYRDQFGAGSLFAVSISKSDNLVSEITAWQTDRSVGTARGIAGGDTIRSVRRVYGPPHSTEETFISGLLHTVYVYKVAGVSGYQRMYLIFSWSDSILRMMILIREGQPFLPGRF